MALDIYFRSDLAQSIEAALRLATRMHVLSGNTNTEYLRGMYAFAEHQSTQYGLNWRSILHNVRESLEVDVLCVLDSALQLQLEAVVR